MTRSSRGHRVKERLGHDPHTERVLQVLQHFRVIYGSVKRHFREVEASCGVSGSQLWALREIGTHPDIGVSDLAARMSIHQSTCSLLLEKLEARGLVIKTRSANDQRRVGLRLSRLAASLLARAPGPAEGLLPEALMALPNDTLQALHDNLDELSRKLRLRDEHSAGKPLADL